VKQVSTNSLELRNEICHFLSSLAPGVVQVVGIDQSTVTWRLPIQPNGIITNYQVIVFEYDDRENVVTDARLDSSQLSYSIPGLGK